MRRTPLSEEAIIYYRVKNFMNKLGVDITTDEGEWQWLLKDVEGKGSCALMAMLVSSYGAWVMQHCSPMRWTLSGAAFDPRQVVRSADRVLDCYCRDAMVCLINHLSRKHLHVCSAMRVGRMAGPWCAKGLLLALLLRCGLLRGLVLALLAHAQRGGKRKPFFFLRS